MNDEYMEYNFLDVDDTSFLSQGEEIICRHCVIISFVSFGNTEEKEIVDFSNYNFQTGDGFVLWACYHIDKGMNEVTINTNCMVSVQVFQDGHREFYWWPAGTITFFKE